MTEEAIKNETLIKLIQNGTDRQENLLLLWNQNQGLIFTELAKYSKSVPIDDLRQSAYLALNDAVDNYNPDEAKFTTYLVFWLKRYAVAEIRKNYPLSADANTLSYVSKLERTQAEYEKKFGTLPSDQELQSLLRMDNALYKRIRNTSESMNTVSMDAPSNVLDDDYITMGDTVSDKNTDIESEVLDRLSNAELHEELEKTLTSLPPEQEQVLRRRYYQDQDTKTVALEMNISESEVRQHREKAFKRIRNDTRHYNTLRTYYEERFPLAYKGSLGKFKRKGSVTEQIAIDLLLKESGLWTLETREQDG